MRRTGTASVQYSSGPGSNTGWCKSRLAAVNGPTSGPCPANTSHDRHEIVVVGDRRPASPELGHEPADQRQPSDYSGAEHPAHPPRAQPSPAERGELGARYDGCLATYGVWPGGLLRARWTPDRFSAPDERAARRRCYRGRGTAGSTPFRHCLRVSSRDHSGGHCCVGTEDGRPGG